MTIHLTVIDLEDVQLPKNDATVAEALACFDEFQNCQINGMVLSYDFFNYDTGHLDGWYTRIAAKDIETDCVYITIRGIDPRLVLRETYLARMEKLGKILLAMFTPFPYEHNTDPGITTDGWSFLKVYPDMESWSDHFAQCERHHFKLVSAQ